jgi:opacity protein-like surface antigen
MKSLSVFLALILASPLLAAAQSLEVSGGYAHISGDNGTDGFNVGAAVRVMRRVSVAFDYDSAWDSSHLGVFELTQTGLIVSKSHLQDFLGGPRISFPGLLKNKKTFLPRLWPFAEAQFGVSHLNSSLDNPATNVSQSASDNAFSWMVGGGADYRLASHWMGRFKVDFLHTNFADTGQNRVRLGFGIAYTFGEGGAKEAAEAKRKADAELAAAEAQKKAMEEADRQKQALRARVLEHFNRVLPTTDTPRGLIVNMGDALFVTGKSDLRPEGREALAKVYGILLTYPPCA